jgi:DHA3 family macrolide efflux protein-like MFS transporter
MNLIKILKGNKQFRYYWLSTSFMHISGLMYNIAIAYFLLSTSLPLYVEIIGISMIISSIMPFPSGFLADKVNRKKFLVITRIIQGTLIFISSINLYTAIFSFLLLTTIVSISSPFSAGLIQSLLRKNEVIGATSINSLTISLFAFTGGILSLLYPILGKIIFLLLVSTLRVSSAILIARISIPRLPSHKNFGLKIGIYKIPVLFSAISFAFVGLLPIIINSYVFSIFKTEESIALISTFTTIGNSIGAIISSQVITNEKILSSIMIGILGLSFSVIGISFIDSMSIYVLILLRGLFTSFQNISWRSWLRINIPNEIMGRIWGSISTISSVLSGIISVLYSFISKNVEPRYFLLSLGFLILVFSIYMIELGRNSKQNSGIFRSLSRTPEKSKTEQKRDYL